MTQNMGAGSDRNVIQSKKAQRVDSPNQNGGDNREERGEEEAETGEPGHGGGVCAVEHHQCQAHTQHLQEHHTGKNGTFRNETATQTHPVLF